jgi:hypothetical protein
MPTCNCGGKKVQIAKHTPRKASVKKAAAPTGGATKNLSKRAQTLSRRATAKATKRANANAAPCKC